MHLDPDDDALRALLATVSTVAIVGVSPDPARPSHSVAAYLREATEWTIWFVNPTVDEILGERCHASLHDLPGRPDLVDVFRRQEFLSGVVDDAVHVGARAGWFQLGLRDDLAARRAADAGLQVVQDRCLRIEHRRLAGT
jgi:predicted CoA-binding protein